MAELKRDMFSTLHPGQIELVTWVMGQVEDKDLTNAYNTFKYHRREVQITHESLQAAVAQYEHALIEASKAEIALLEVVTDIHDSLEKEDRLYTELPQ